MLFSHVYGLCSTVWSGFAIFPLEVSTQSPLPNSCLEMVASNVHISLSFIVCFIVFIHGLFYFLVPFNLFLISNSCHCFMFFLLSFYHLFLISCFFLLKKTITNLNHLHVDPRLSSAEYCPNPMVQSCFDGGAVFLGTLNTYYFGFLFQYIYIYVFMYV